MMKPTTIRPIAVAAAPWRRMRPIGYHSVAPVDSSVRDSHARRQAQAIGAPNRSEVDDRRTASEMATAMVAAAPTAAMAAERLPQARPAIAIGQCGEDEERQREERPAERRDEEERRGEARTHSDKDDLHHVCRCPAFGAVRGRSREDPGRAPTIKESE